MTKPANAQKTANFSHPGIAGPESIYGYSKNQQRRHGLCEPCSGVPSLFATVAEDLGQGRKLTCRRPGWPLRGTRIGFAR